MTRWARFLATVMAAVAAATFGSVKANGAARKIFARGYLARLFLGSVAERVIGTAPCPVLVVRGR